MIHGSVSMPAISLICFALFALIAMVNAISVLTSTHKRHRSVVPMVGLVLFVVAMMGWPNPPIWAWLLVFFDLGTLMFVLSLPSFIVDGWQTSRFCCYAVFTNDQETLTLYRHNAHQSFRWDWTADELPTLGVVSFSGDWRQMGDEFLFYANINQPYFKAVLQDGVLMVVDTDDDYVQFNNKRYQQLVNKQ